MRSLELYLKYPSPTQKKKKVFSSVRHLESALVEVIELRILYLSRMRVNGLGKGSRKCLSNTYLNTVRASTYFTATILGWCTCKISLMKTSEFRFTNFLGRFSVVDWMKRLEVKIIEQERRDILDRSLEA